MKTEHNCKGSEPKSSEVNLFYWEGRVGQTQNLALADLSYLWCEMAAEQVQPRTSLGLARNLKRRAENHYHISKSLFIYSHAHI